MNKTFYKIKNFPIYKSNNGSLMALQAKDFSDATHIPFQIKRVLIIKDVNNDTVRGGHTHNKTRQILFVINGACTINLDNGKEKDEVFLDSYSKGILLEPYVWHTMSNFAPNTILLVLANTEYDEEDYIRDYDEFLKFIK